MNGLIPESTDKQVLAGVDRYKLMLAAVGYCCWQVLLGVRGCWPRSGSALDVTMCIASRRWRA